MVNSAAEAAAAVAHCRYPPLGARSYGPIRSELVIGPAPAVTNAAVVCLVMIETAAAVDAVEEICATPGVDGVYIGPVDLAISLGQTPRLGPVPGPHADAMERVRVACAANGLVAGVHAASGEQARQYVESGYQMVTVSSDLAMLRSYARTQLRNARQTDTAS
jgi:4-hydroxy-2-oxoheptanedioate aldolase